MPVASYKLTVHKQSRIVSEGEINCAHDGIGRTAHVEIIACL